MQSLLLHPTPTAQWRAIVHEAQAAADRHLDEDLESYLVFLLMRFTDRPEMVKAVLALEFLSGVASLGSLRQERLRDVGDQCLIYSGLFPRQAERRCVSLGYFVGMGRTAYQQLSDVVQYQHSDLFSQLARAFVALMDILQMIRELGENQPALDPLLAMESWSETGSRYALNVLQGVTDGTPVLPPQDPKRGPSSH